MKFNSRRHVIEIAPDEIVAADDPMALFQKMLGKMTSEKPGNASDKVSPFFHVPYYNDSLSDPPVLLALKMNSRYTK